MYKIYKDYEWIDIVDELTEVLSQRESESALNNQTIIHGFQDYKSGNYPGVLLFNWEL